MYCSPIREVRAVMPEKDQSVDQMIGMRIRASREAQGYSLQEVANEVGCTNVHLSTLENGRRRWNSEILFKTCLFLNIPPGLVLDPDVPVEKFEVMGRLVKKLSPYSEERIEAFLNLLDSFSPDSPA